MNKKGLSDVLMTVITVSVAVLLIIIVWVIISGLLQSGALAQGGSSGEIFSDLKLEKVVINEDNSVSVTLKRGKRTGNLVGIFFSVSDGFNSELIEKETTLKELESGTFVLSEEDLGNVLFAKDISIAPIFQQDSNNKISSRFVDQFTFSNEEIIKNFGAISWWRYQDGAKDEFGKNPGIIKGANCDVKGKYGKACNFDGVDDYIDIGNYDNLDGENSFSISFWIYKNGNDKFAENEGLFSRGSDGGKSPWIYGYENTFSLFAQFETDDAVSDCSIATGTIRGDRWTQIVFSWNGSVCHFHEDGILTNKDPTKGNILIDTDGDNYIGKFSNGGYFDGLIDEVIVFDRALTNKQVQFLYKLDFS